MNVNKNFIKCKKEARLLLLIAICRLPYSDSIIKIHSQTPHNGAVGNEKKKVDMGWTIMERNEHFSIERFESNHFCTSQNELCWGCFPQSFSFSKITITEHRTVRSQQFSTCIFEPLASYRYGKFTGGLFLDVGRYQDDERIACRSFSTFTPSGVVVGVEIFPAIVILRMCAVSA